MFPPPKKKIFFFAQNKHPEKGLKLFEGYILLYNKNIKWKKNWLIFIPQKLVLVLGKKKKQC